MRRALVVGIDYYPTAALEGCVEDACRVAAVLGRHADGEPNFDCWRLLGSENREVTRAMLLSRLDHLFRDESDVVLFYFSGHGTESNLGGYLATSDARKYNEGVSLTDVLTLADNSVAREVVILLDCCHSGSFGQLPAVDNRSAVLREGVSVLTASRSTQPAVEVEGRGLFTSLVCDALEGGAADVLGHVTVAAIYNYVDQALGSWDQRPLLKSHVSKLVKLRRTSSSRRRPGRTSSKRSCIVTVSSGSSTGLAPPVRLYLTRSGWTRAKQRRQSSDHNMWGRPSDGPCYQPNGW